MNFIEMVKQVKSGMLATRPDWRAGEFVSYNGRILVHTHPYFSSDKLVGDKYPYLVEECDTEHTDWLVVKPS